MPRRVTGSTAFRGAPCQLCAGTPNGFHTCLSHPLGRSRPTQPAGRHPRGPRRERGGGVGYNSPHFTRGFPSGGALLKPAARRRLPARRGGRWGAAAAGQASSLSFPPLSFPPLRLSSPQRPAPPQERGRPASPQRRRRSRGLAGPGRGSGAAGPSACGRGRPAFRQSGAGRSLRLSARLGAAGEGAATSSAPSGEGSQPAPRSHVWRSGEVAGGQLGLCPSPAAARPFPVPPVSATPGKGALARSRPLSRGEAGGAGSGVPEAVGRGRRAALRSPRCPPGGAAGQRTRLPGGPTSCGLRLRALLPSRGSGSGPGSGGRGDAVRTGKF